MAGRPKIEIDYEAVARLSAMMCTQDEIAQFLGISTRTLQRDKEFCRVYKKGLDVGKMSLRRTQFKHAEKNASMAMFLGKVYLGQRERDIEGDNTQKDKKTPKIEITVVDNSDLESVLYEGEENG